MYVTREFASHVILLIDWKSSVWTKGWYFWIFYVLGFTPVRDLSGDVTGGFVGARLVEGVIREVFKPGEAMKKVATCCICIRSMTRWYYNGITNDLQKRRKTWIQSTSFELAWWAGKEEKVVRGAAKIQFWIYWSCSCRGERRPRCDRFRPNSAQENPPQVSSLKRDPQDKSWLLPPHSRGTRNKEQLLNSFLLVCKQ